jgi:triosephosphate isomerase (TIM)
MTKTTSSRKREVLVVGNWKLNPTSQAKANALFADIKKTVRSNNANAKIAVCTPFIFIGGLGKYASTGRVALGAQDAFYEMQGAFTGEISPSMLKDAGVSYVIVGHSERRALGEGNEMVGKKASAVLATGLTAVVCVGENTRDAHGDYFTVIETQLKAILGHVQQQHLSRLVFAYEPVWAIGTGKHATAEDVHEMKLFIQKVIADNIGRAAVIKIRILYGGSVNKDNAQELLVEGQVDGFLVGGASLKVAEFKGIVEISDRYGQ